MHPVASADAYLSLRHNILAVFDPFIIYEFDVLQHCIYFEQVLRTGLARIRKHVD
jgi:hypothetical protein